MNSDLSGYVAPETADQLPHTTPSRPDIDSLLVLESVILNLADTLDRDLYRSLGLQTGTSIQHWTTSFLARIYRINTLYRQRLLDAVALHAAQVRNERPDMTLASSFSHLHNILVDIVRLVEQIDIASRAVHTFLPPQFHHTINNNLGIDGPLAQRARQHDINLSRSVHDVNCVLNVMLLPKATLDAIFEPVRVLSLPILYSASTEVASLGGRIQHLLEQRRDIRKTIIDLHDAIRRTANDTTTSESRFDIIDSLTCLRNLIDTQIDTQARILTDATLFEAAFEESPSHLQAPDGSTLYTTADLLNIFDIYNRLMARITHVTRDATDARRSLQQLLQHIERDIYTYCSPPRA